MTNMPPPFVDHDPVGRHGEVLSHDLFAETPIADMIDARVFGSRSVEVETSAEVTNLAERAETRRAQIAVADTVGTVRYTPTHKAS